MISVIAMHVNVCFWTFSYENYWRDSVIIETMFYWAVPIFFMVSGAMLIDYRERYGTKEYFKKRVLKTFIPFLIWSLISIVYRVCIGAMQFSIFEPKNLFNAILNSQGLTVYWFFMPLFAVYFGIPILGLIPKEKRKRVYSYMAVMAFLTVSFLPISCSVLNIAFPDNLKFPAAGGYFIFILLGYLLVHEYKFSGLQRIGIYAIGLLGWFIRYYTVLHWSLADGKINNTMGEYINFPTVLFGVAVFVFVKDDLSRLFIFKKISPKFLRALSSASFGVYLIHYYFVEQVPLIMGFDIRSVLWRTAGVLIIYIICVIIVLIIQKIPVLRRLVP
jgi:surface polysaccharide O-acyltransferase-like enzyme